MCSAIYRCRSFYSNSVIESQTAAVWQHDDRSRDGTNGCPYAYRRTALRSTHWYAWPPRTTFSGIPPLVHTTNLGQQLRLPDDATG